MILDIFTLCLFITSCYSDDDNDSPQTINLIVNLDGLGNLGSDFVYENWGIVEGVPVSTGVFTVDSDCVLSETSFTLDSGVLDSASKFVLSIEPSVDLYPTPFAQKLVAGYFSGNTAILRTDVAPAVGDFSAAACTFFLRNPTDETDGNNGNDENGVWFGFPGMPPTPSLELPELPEGWIYEGWVIGDGGPLSTGTFTSFDTIDDNAGLSSSFGGTERIGPPIPGEDFFINAPAGEIFPLDIRGSTVVISVAPVPGNSPTPFLLKPLLGIAEQETAPSTHEFGFNVASLPTGTVIR